MQRCARLDEARQALGLAETRLRETVLLSPISGVVLSENIEAGEFASPGTGIVTVGDLRRPWLRPYIDETDLGRVKIGQRVSVTADTWLDRTYEGRVTFMSDVAEFTFRNVQTRKERVKLVYRIKVSLDNPVLELKPGMPADAVNHTRESVSSAPVRPATLQTNRPS